MNDRILRLFEKAWFEAKQADWLWTAPNPRVGAIALKQGQIVGRGCHQVFGGPHAEEAALRDARAWDDEADTALPGSVDEMVVTLEPCSALGKKRPPCTQALIDAGVQRLWVGAVDPDPRHAGAGLDKLREAGMQVELCDDPRAASEFATANRAFLRAQSNPDRPWVLAKWASSLDGKTAADSGESRWISCAESRAEVHRLRACSEAVLAGANTLRLDDPSLDARPQDGPVGVRSAEAPAKQPIRVLVGGASEVSAEATVFAADSPRVWFIGNQQSAVEAVQSAGDDVHCVAQDSNGRLGWPEILRVLRHEYGIRRLFVEGGARIHGSLLAAGLLDAVVRYEAPLLLGGSAAACAGASFQSPRHAIRLVEEERKQLSMDLRRAFQCEAVGDTSS